MNQHELDLTKKEIVAISMAAAGLATIYFISLAAGVALISFAVVVALAKCL